MLNLAYLTMQKHSVLFYLFIFDNLDPPLLIILYKWVIMISHNKSEKL